MEMTPSMPRRQLLIVLGSLMLGTALGALDNTIIASALPTIVGKLNGFKSFAWVGTIYIVTSTISTPILGKLSDLYGRKLLFQFAISTFLVGSVLCALSHSMSQLIAARGVQGIGAGGIQSLTFAILGDIITPRERGKYMGLYTSVFAVAAVAGPLVGGFMIEHWAWQWIFLINVPIGGAALVATQINLRFPFGRRKAAIDYLGAALLSAGLAALMIGLDRTREGWGTAGVGPLLGLAAVMLGAFALWERRASEPLVPPRLLRNPIIVSTYGMAVTLGAVMFGASQFFPLFFQDARFVSPTKAGLFTLPIMAGVMTGSTMGGRLISATGRYKLVPVVGLAGSIIGVGAIAVLLDADIAYPKLIVPMFLMGLGGGSSFTTQSIAAQNAVDPRDLGVATSTLNFCRSLGASVALAMYGSVFNAKVRDELTRRLPDNAGTTASQLIKQIREPARIKALAPPLRDAVRDSIGAGAGRVYLVALPVVIAAWFFALSLREIPLGRTTGLATTPVE